MEAEHSAEQQRLTQQCAGLNKEVGRLSEQLADRAAQLQVADVQAGRRGREMMKLQERLGQQEALINARDSEIEALRLRVASLEREQMQHAAAAQSRSAPPASQHPLMGPGSDEERLKAVLREVVRGELAGSLAGAAVAPVVLTHELMQRHERRMAGLMLAAQLSGRSNNDRS